MGKSRPILFNTAMVQAIRDKRKTQTRRVMKPQPTGTRINTYPYGQPENELWIKETWATIPEYDDVKPVDLPKNAPIYYKADGISDEAGKLRPSIFMMKWMSRITLVVKRVRIERIQDITKEDVQAEGVTHHDWNHAQRNLFPALWDKINAKRGFPWDSNPWTWVIEFNKKVDNP